MVIPTTADSQPSTICLVGNHLNDENVSRPENSPKEFDFHDLEREVQRRVAERRSLGLYPVGMEIELEKQFKFVTALGGTLEKSMAKVGQSIEKLEATLTQGVQPVSNRSKWPFGARLHRLIQNSSRRLIDVERDRNDAVLGKVLEVLYELQRSLGALDDLERKKTQVLSNEVLSRLVLLDSISSRMVEFEMRLNSLPPVESEG